MIGVHLTRVFRVTAGDLDAHTDLLMEELHALEGEHVTDADISAELSRGIVEVSIFAVAETFDDAIALGDATIRSAIHAAGGASPAWVELRRTAESELISS